MWNFTGNLAIDPDTEDDDDELVMQVSGLYNQSLPSSRFLNQGANESWFRMGNLIADLITICGKINDKKWLNRGQNCYCIYYSCHMLGTLAQLNAKSAIKLAQYPNCLENIINLWYLNGFPDSSNIESYCHTWFESRAAARAISNFLSLAPELKYKIYDICHEKLGINFVETALKQYAHCVDYVMRRWTICPTRIEGYVQDLLLKVKGKSWDYDEELLCNYSIEFATNWKNFNGTILSAAAAFYLPIDYNILKSLNLGIINENNINDYNNKIIKSFSECDIKLIDQACFIDLGYEWDDAERDSSNKLEYVAHDTALDMLIALTS